jgi:small-conductance mechanosensitive channel
MKHGIYISCILSILLEHSYIAMINSLFFCMAMLVSSTTFYNIHQVCIAIIQQQMCRSRLLLLKKTMGNGFKQSIMEIWIREMYLMEHESETLCYVLSVKNKCACNFVQFFGWSQFGVLRVTIIMFVLFPLLHVHVVANVNTLFCYSPLHCGMWVTP